MTAGEAGGGVRRFHDYGDGMEEYADGDWVKWEDHQKLEAHARHLEDALRDIIFTCDLYGEFFGKRLASEALE